MDCYKIYYKYFEEELEKYIAVSGREPTGAIIDEYVYEVLLKYSRLLFDFDEDYKLKTFKGIKLTIGNGLKLIYFY